MAANDDGAGQGGTAKSVLGVVAQVIAPSAVLVSLLFYFGWVRTNAIFMYFGVDPRLLAYGREDYLVRSAYSSFRPTVVLLVIVAVAFVSYLALKELLRHMHGAGRVRVIVGLGILGLLAVWVGASEAVSWWLPHRFPPAFAAFLLGAGAAVLEGVASLTGWEDWALGRRVILASVVVASLFWSFAISAQNSGDRLARGWGDAPSARPAITIVSREDLGVRGPGIDVERVPAATESPHGGRTVPWFRYTGLRLLIYSNQRWFLIPDQWGKHGDRRALVIRDSADLRIETSP